MNRNLLFFNFFLVFFVAIIAQQIIKQDFSQTQDSNQTQNFNQTVDTYVQSFPHFSGVICVLKNNNIVHKKAYGYANIDLKNPNTCSTKFAIASNTKTFTAVAIMILQEQNKLQVHDKVNKYIPGFPDTITIHHLLTHTSGLPNYNKYWNDVADCLTIKEMVDKTKNWNLESIPGSPYAYSNTGYLLLAHLIEQVSNMSFSQFLQHHIFTPLQMLNSGSINDATYAEHKALGYQTIDTAYAKNESSDYQIINDIIAPTPSLHSPLTLTGSGNIYSSIDDMHVWIQSLFSHKIINAQSLASLISPHVAMTSSPDRFYGYGCFIDKLSNKRFIDHSGVLVGFLSKVIHFIDDNITIIVLTNIENRQQIDILFDQLPDVVLNL